jgi:hypothetical protein
MGMLRWGVEGCCEDLRRSMLSRLIPKLAIRALFYTLWQEAPSPRKKFFLFDTRQLGVKSQRREGIFYLLILGGSE